VRFHIGGIPEAPDFHPLAEGWRAIREPGPLAMQILGLPLLIVSVSVTIVVLEHIAISWAGLNAIMQLPFLVFFLVHFLVIFLVIAVHELLHALIHPGNGRSGLTVLGCWPRKGLFYAHFEGEMSRNRFLAVLLAPAVGLTVLPLVLAWAIGSIHWSLGLVALINAFALYGDLFGILLILFQIPSDALVKNKGFRTYWRYPSAAVPSKPGLESEGASLHH
jgi:putative zincin peptidase